MSSRTSMAKSSSPRAHPRLLDKSSNVHWHSHWNLTTFHPPVSFFEAVTTAVSRTRHQPSIRSAAHSLQPPPVPSSAATLQATSLIPAVMTLGSAAVWKNRPRSPAAGDVRRICTSMPVHPRHGHGRRIGTHDGSQTPPDHGPRKPTACSICVPMNVYAAMRAMLPLLYSPPPQHEQSFPHSSAA